MERARTAAKCAKMKKAHAKQAKLLFIFSLLNMEICDILVTVVVVLTSATYCERMRGTRTHLTTLLPHFFSVIQCCKANLIA